MLGTYSFNFRISFCMLYSFRCLIHSIYKVKIWLIWWRYYIFIELQFTYLFTNSVFIQYSTSSSIKSTHDDDAFCPLNEIKWCIKKNRWGGIHIQRYHVISWGCGWKSTKLNWTFCCLNRRKNCLPYERKRNFFPSDNFTT